VNSLYDGGKNTNRRFKSDAYKAWLEHASYSIMAQRDRRHRHTGHVEVVYTFSPPDKRQRDVFNYEKAVSDFLVSVGILADDSQIQKGTVQWMSGPPVTVLISDLEGNHQRK
jgi:Holliday junction resolvase RusA-like endonuclease